MYENDYDYEMFTSEELLAEIGLAVYTIRNIRAEALHPETGGEEKFCSV